MSKLGDRKWDDGHEKGGSLEGLVDSLQALREEVKKIRLLGKGDLHSIASKIQSGIEEIETNKITRKGDRIHREATGRGTGRSQGWLHDLIAEPKLFANMFSNQSPKNLVFKTDRVKKGKRRSQ